MPVIDEESEQYQSEMQEIISAPPPWLIQWGMMIFFGILLMLLGLSAMIRYPDIVKTQLKINSANSPKPVVTKISGKLIRLMARDNQYVQNSVPLAYLESTGNHEKILETLNQLKLIQARILNDRTSSSQAIDFLNTPGTFELGELQGSYQNFYQSFLKYKSSISEGFYLKKRIYLQKDLEDILKQRRYLLSQKVLQEKEYQLAKQEYEMHKDLFEQKVEAKMELKREEAKFLSSQHPLEQIQSSLLTSQITYSAKEKEIMELDNQINEAKSSFMQALNSQISEMEIWKSKYVLSASQAGRVAFTTIIQENQFINANQELFFINPGNTDFFGIMSIPQFSMGKIKTGQEVLIKLKSFPYEEYGILRGKIASITEVPYQDSIFISRVNFQVKSANFKKPVFLKNGMTADAEIITEKASLLTRLMRNVIKIME